MYHAETRDQRDKLKNEASDYSLSLWVVDYSFKQSAYKNIHYNQRLHTTDTVCCCLKMNRNTRLQTGGGIIWLSQPWTIINHWPKHVQTCPSLTFIVALDGLTLLKLFVSHTELPQEDFVLRQSWTGSSCQNIFIQRNKNVHFSGKESVCTFFCETRASSELKHEKTGIN